MSASDDYCDFCDLPRSQCIHGMPAPAPVQKTAPAQKPTTAPRPRKTPETPARTAPTRVVNRRWNPPEVFKPLILTVLEEAGGELDADDLFLELEIAADDLLLPGDRESTPEGELRWRYAARRARMALVDEGLMTRGRPGVWALARPRRGRG